MKNKKRSMFSGTFFTSQTLKQLRLRCFYKFSLFLCLALFSSHNFVQAQTIEQNFQPSLEEIGGIISTVVTQPDGKILLGGYFRFIDKGKRINIARLNSDRTLDTSFNPGAGANEAVTSIVIQGDGKILVGGYFTMFDGRNAGGIVRLNSNGSIDTTFDSTGINIGINTGMGILAISPQPDGKFLIGGNFSNYRGTTVKNLIRINSNGTRDITFNPSNTVIAGIVNNVKLLSNGKIYTTINFNNQFGNMSRLIRFNSDGTTDTSFGSTVRTFEIKTIAVQADGKILVGGNSPQGTFSISLIRYNENGTIDAGFNTTSNANVHSIIPEANGKIIIAGDFDVWNEQPQIRFARLNSDGSLDNSFASDTQINFAVRTAAKLSDGSFLLGGVDTQRGDGVDNPISLQNTDGNIDNSFATKVKLNSSSKVMAVQPDGKILVAGEFTFVNGESRKGFARLNSNGTLDSSFDVDTDKPVETIAVQNDGKILLGGKFKTVNGVNQTGITRLNSDGTIDATFDSGTGAGGNFSAYVSKIIVLNSGKIIIGGTFAAYNDIQRKGIARLNSDGSLDTTFDAGEGITGGSEIVHSIVPQSDGKLLIGGNFVYINGVQRVGIGRINANGSLDTTFNNVGLSNSIFTIALQPNGKILIGGFFNVINGIEFNYIARLNSDGSVDTGFNIGTGFSGGQSFTDVEKIVLQPDGKILVGGNFTSYKNSVSNYLTRLNPDGSKDTSFNIGAGPNSKVNSLILQTNGKILFGGLFSEVSGEFHSGIARLSSNQTNKPIFDFDGDGKTDTSIFRSDVGQWWYRQSSSGQTGVTTFGTSSDKLVPADYSGDGKTDIAFWRPATGEWFVLRSDDFNFYALPFGQSGDIPAPGDYDGDGMADVAVYRPSQGVWYIRQSSGGINIVQFGLPEDKPTIADYDGDGKDDIAIYRPSVSQWWQVRSTGGVGAVQFGQAGDKTQVGDYTGDGKADLAFFRPSNGFWYILKSDDSNFFAFPFGAGTDIPAAGDYDGDGKTDAAVFRRSNGIWYINGTQSGVQYIQFGATNDVILPNVYSVP